ncbi:unnamed protein product [Moneuplotes crassus]|uniref:Uncharacterized protein n=1 Tax=Euplotes crassus TaxID=5936 RepID=A0AAD1ULN4_EUPCR|nr:unnamed protein product [Moneuplotes crassus]
MNSRDSLSTDRLNKKRKQLNEMSTGKNRGLNMSPDIERSSLVTHNKLFNDTTAESFNIHGQSSTITSPVGKSRQDGENSRIKFQAKMNTSSAMMLMNNLNSITLDTSKKSVKASQSHKKFSFTSSVEETGEPIDTSSATINPKVMETWLNDILQESKDIGLKSSFLKHDKQKPINQYGIDRQSLLKLGLSKTLVNRIYRGLFVYSVGFFELLKKCSVESSSKSNLMATIWRVYAILLEFCCKTDYDLMISEITRVSREEISDLKAKLEKLTTDFSEKEAKIIEKYDELRSQTETAEKKTQSYVIHIEKLNEYIEELRKRNEDEISIRKQFEAKLNELHSFGRDHDVKYYRALEEIDEHIQKYQITEKELKDLEQQTLVLNKEKIALETKLADLETKCNTLSNENLGINRALNKVNLKKAELEDTNKKLKREYANTVKDLKNVSFKQNIDEMKNQKLAGDIAELTEKYEKRNKAAEGHEARIDELEVQLAKETKSKQYFEREYKSIKSHEEEYTAKNIALLDEMDRMTYENTSIKEKSEAIQTRYDQHEKQLQDLTKSYSVLNRTLKKVNEERKKLYEDAVRSEKLATKYEAELASTKEILEEEKINFNKINTRFSDMELEYENTEVSKNKAIREIEIEKEVIEHKLEKSLELKDKYSRDIQDWVKRYEEEYQSHIKTLNLLNNSKVKIKDVECEKMRLVSDIKELDKMNKKQIKILKEKEQVQSDISKENEKLRIHNRACEENIKNMAHHHKEYITRLKKEHRKVMAERDGWYNRTSMEHEDVYMRAVKLYEENKKNHGEVKIMKSQIKLYRDKFKKANEQLEGYKKKHNHINTQLDQVYRENEALKEEVASKNDQIIELSEKRLELYLEKEGIKDELQTAKGREILKKLSLKREQKSTTSRKNSLESNTDNFEGNSILSDQLTPRNEMLESCNKKCQTDFTISRSKAVQTFTGQEKSQFFRQKESPSRKITKNLKYQKALSSQFIKEEISRVSDQITEEKLSKEEREFLWTSGKQRGNPITNVILQENNFINDHSSTTSILPALKKTANGGKTSRNAMFMSPRSPEQKSLDTLKTSKTHKKFARHVLTSAEHTSLKNDQSRLKSIYGKKRLLSKKARKELIKGEEMVESYKGIKNMIKGATSRE